MATLKQKFKRHFTASNGVGPRVLCEAQPKTIEECLCAAIAKALCERFPYFPLNIHLFTMATGEMSAGEQLGINIQHDRYSVDMTFYGDELEINFIHPERVRSFFNHATTEHQQVMMRLSDRDMVKLATRQVIKYCKQMLSMWRSERFNGQLETQRRWMQIGYDATTILATTEDV